MENINTIADNLRKIKENGTIAATNLSEICENNSDIKECIIKGAEEISEVSEKRKNNESINKNRPINLLIIIPFLVIILSVGYLLYVIWSVVLSMHDDFHIYWDAGYFNCNYF